MTVEERIKQTLSHLDPKLIEEINNSGTVQSIDENTEILREGQYVKVIPIVLKGLIKVFSRHDDKELLLYYIRPEESCIMSFAASLKNSPSKVFAVTEEDADALLLPTDKIPVWTKQYPDFNTLFYQQYNLRYSELLETIHHLLFDRMDKRLFDYLTEKAKLTGKNPLKISHRQIANELGTAREVISRVMKKLEQEGKVRQLNQQIEITQL